MTMADEIEEYVHVLRYHIIIVYIFQPSVSPTHKVKKVKNEF